MIFVAFDFEFHKDRRRSSHQRRGPGLIDEVGVSTLDTCDLLSQPVSSSTVCELIVSESRRIPKQIPLNRPTFLFGTSEVIVREELEQYLNSKILKRDENGGYRNVVVAGHEIRAERLAMKNIGIDLYDIERYPSVVGILDTRLLSYLVLERRPEFTYNTSLDGILQSFGVPFRKEYMHIAGNDANFTLKALLMIAVWSVEGLKLNPDQISMVAKLKAIAQTPIDDTISNPTVSFIARHHHLSWPTES